MLSDSFWPAPPTATARRAVSCHVMRNQSMCFWQSFVNRTESRHAASFRVTPFCTVPIRFTPSYIVLFRVTPSCVAPFRVTPSCVMPHRFKLRCANRSMSSRTVSLPKHPMQLKSGFIEMQRTVHATLQIGNTSEQNHVVTSF